METVVQAQRLGLSGWVRNVSDGSVEAWAEGEEAGLAELEKWLHSGPEKANVLNVDSAVTEPRGYTLFEKKPSIDVSDVEQIY